MIKAKKGLLIGLFAAMMVFAFGATSAFAQSYPATDSQGKDLMSRGGTIDQIVWDQENGEYARVEVTAQDGTQKWYRFDLMTDAQIEKMLTTTPQEATDVLVLKEMDDYPLDDSDHSGQIWASQRQLVHYTYKWDPMTGQEPETGWWDGADHEGCWIVGGGHGLWTGWTDTSKTWDVQNQTDAQIDVVDMNDQMIYAADATDDEDTYDVTAVNGGDYSAWKALKDLEDTTSPDYRYKKAVVDAAKAWEVGSVFTTPDAEDWADYAELWSPSYGDYNAFAYDKAEGSNLKVNVTVTPNVSAIKAWLGKMHEGNYIVLNKPAVFELQANASNLGTEKVSRDYWTSYSWYSDLSTPIEALYGIYYDGKEHTAGVWNHVGEAVTVKYAVMPKKADGTYDEPTDADWADTAVIKDAGTYKVMGTMTMDRYSKPNDDQKATFEKIITIEPFPILMGFSQKELNAEYGKYTKESLEAAIKDLFVSSNNAPDSQDAIAQAITKYGTVLGLFTEAGKGTLYADIDKTALAADATLSEAVKNYDFDYDFSYIDPDYGYISALTARGKAKVGVPNTEMTLSITQAPNRVDFASVTKTYHIKKAKKLKKAKKFQLNATATYGDVKFAKTSGSTKVKVSKTGKVTVKKGTKKGTYKVKVKAYVNGTANYSAAAQTVAIYVKVKK